jgi:hypothetical protein
MVRAQIGGPREVGPGRAKVKRMQGRTALKSFRPLVLFVLLAAPLLGCSQKITVCPIPAILNDTAQVTFFRPGTTPDLANELYTVSLDRAESDCVYNNSTQIVRASLDLTFRATRAPSTAGASYSVPYFVVVHEGARIYAKHAYTLNFSFAPGAATSVIKQAPNQTRIKIANGKLPWNYQLLAGFQMTDEQIAYTKAKSRYQQ